MTASALKLIGLGMPAGLSNLVGNTVVTTAGVGTAQVGAKSLTNNVNNLTTSGGATAFIISDAWSIGDSIQVFNTSATAALLYPPVGSAFDGGSTDASVSIVQNSSRTYTRTASTVWRSGGSVSAPTTLTVSGNATIGGTLGVTGATTLAAVTATSVSTTGPVTAKSGTTVPATAGAVAAGAPLVLFSTGISLWVTSDAPTHTATKGDLCINTGGSSSSTRLYINNGTTTWIAVTTAS